MAELAKVSLLKLLQFDEIESLTSLVWNFYRKQFAIPYIFTLTKAKSDRTLRREIQLKFFKAIMTFAWLSYLRHPTGSKQPR